MANLPTNPPVNQNGMSTNTPDSGHRPSFTRQHRNMSGRPSASGRGGFQTRIPGLHCSASGPRPASDPQSFAYHNQLDGQEYQPLLPGPPISLLKRDVPKSKDYCVWKVAYQFKQGSIEDTSMTTSDHFSSDTDAMKAALALPFSYGFGEAQQSTERDRDGVTILKRGPNPDGRYLWVWVEKFYIQATAVPEKHNREEWLAEYDKLQWQDDKHRPKPHGYYALRGLEQAHSNGI